jgi:hypothetical protein
VRLLHVIQLRAPTQGLYSSLWTHAETTGTAGLLLLREMMACFPDSRHDLVLVGVEHDLVLLERHGIFNATLLSPAMLRPRGALARLEQIATDLKPTLVLGWGTCAGAVVEAMPSWVTRGVVDLRRSDLTLAPPIATACSIAGGSISRTPRFDRTLSRARLGVGSDVPVVLMLADVATPHALHLAMYAVGSVAVAGHASVVILPAGAGYEPDLLALVRAQHYVREVLVVDQSIERLAAAADAAILCTSEGDRLGVAASEVLVHACVRQATPVYMTLDSSRQLALPRECFSPNAARGNHTDLAMMLLRAREDRAWAERATQSQFAWSQSRASCVDVLWSEMLAKPLLVENHGVTHA